MHIGVIAPPWLPIRRDGRGDVERVIYDLVESFIDAGEQVTLFAPAGSKTRAHLLQVIDEAAGVDLPVSEAANVLEEYGRRVQRAARQLGLDIVCDHTEITYANSWRIPVLRTIHRPFTEASLERCRLHIAAGDVLLGVNQRQVELFAAAGAGRFGAVIPNPVDVIDAPFFDPGQKDDVAAYVGRCRPENGPVEAIEVAMRAGVPLRMSLRISAAERSYFETEVEPLLTWASEFVEYIGEVDGQERDNLFGRAKVLIVSSTGDEPSGLMIAESLARGTPVAALRRGSAPEMIRDGVTGVLSRDFASMASRLQEAMTLDPHTCRNEALQRFDRRLIAGQHLELIRRLTLQRTHIPGQAPVPGEASSPAAVGTMPAYAFGAGSNAA